MSPTLEFLIVVFEFVARIVVPFVLVFGVLYLLKRWLEPRVNGKVMSAVNGKTFLIAALCLVAIAVIGVIGYALVTNQFIDLMLIFRDVVVLAYLFFLRVLAPLVVLYLAGTWLQRKLNPTAMRDQKPRAERIPILRRVKIAQLSSRLLLGVLFLAALWIGAIGIAITRFFFGLGYVTNLSDEFPWGLWIGFDVVSGVALAAGGFVVAGTVHVFNLKRYEPIVRPAILTALLGYLLVIVGLLFDLGRWYNLWHPIFGFWNIHSVMLEVAWCVILYTLVLALEFSPAIYEKFNLRLPLRIMRAITIPLVIVGMTLSTLHQSSLGSLFLIAPQKINPLWYSPLLPVFFFISAVALGLGMVIVEANLSARGFGRAIESDLLAGLGRAASVVVGLYVLLKAYDLIARGVWVSAFTPSFHSAIFWIEMLAGVIAPMLVLALPRLRANARAVFASGGLIVFGAVFNRLNTSLLGWWAYMDGGPVYIPSLSEFAITFTLLSLGVVAFALVAKIFPVFEHHPAHA